MSIKVKPVMLGELEAFEIATDDAVAVLTPHGAHIISYRPFETEDDLLFVSEKAKYTPGKAVRGGIPVCWPWFGKVAQPPHGVARSNKWDMSAVREEADGSASVTLTFDWYGQSATLDVNIGKSLTVQLTTKNLTGSNIPFSDALHTYFRVGDVRKIRISGFDGCEYDCALTRTRHTQEGDITIGENVDRIYYPGRNIAVIDDPVLDRKIRVERFGSDSAVVWNPWAEMAATIADFGDDEYTQMVCIEAANAGDDARALRPEAIHILGTRISLI